MAQNTTTIESVWASQGNLPNSAIVATADGKYPALDGSLITNVGAGDLLAANNLSELTATASVARTNLELGDTDAVEFGSLETSQLNFPSLSTAELNAVTDATEGDTYFDSDRGQFVRFTGAASHDVITSRTFNTPDISSASSAITLQASRFFESGLILATDILNPAYSLTVFSNNSFGDPAGTTYIYSDGAFTPAGWYDLADNFGPIITAPVVTSDTQYRFNLNSENKFFEFHRFVASDVSDNSLASASLKGGSTYRIDVSLYIGDLKTANLRFDAGYTGLYASADCLQTCDDLTTGQRIGSIQTTLIENDNFTYAENTKLGIDSPSLGYYTFRFNITPSSDGDFSFSVRQKLSDADGLMVGKALVVSTLIAD